jgi:hypothetical protein
LRAVAADLFFNPQTQVWSRLRDSRQFYFVWIATHSSLGTQEDGLVCQPIPVPTQAPFDVNVKLYWTQFQIHTF